MDNNANDAALVLFSGGQDSATCLAWALANFARVETIGFAYGQRHAVELEYRTALLQEFANRDADLHSGEIPLWLVEGLTQQLLALHAPQILLEPPTEQPGGFSFTTTNLTPKQIHDVGLAEVARIRGEMEKVKAQAGFTGTLPEFFAFLRTDGRFYCSDEKQLLIGTPVGMDDGKRALFNDTVWVKRVFRGVLCKT